MVTLLVIGVILTDIHSLIHHFFPQTAEIEYVLWLDKSYKEKITVLWYFYEITSIINHIIWCYVFARVAGLISHRLFMIAIVFFVYYTTQFAFYIYNRNTVFFSNIIVYIYMSVAILFLLLPSKKGGKLINLEDF